MKHLEARLYWSTGQDLQALAAIDTALSLSNSVEPEFRRERIRLFDLGARIYDERDERDLSKYMKQRADELRSLSDSSPQE